jgi:hypothetical protein
MQPAVRLARVLFWLAGVLTVLVVVFAVYAPNVPYRGMPSKTLLQMAEVFATVMFAVLLIVVVDVSRLSAVFIEKLKGGHTVYSRAVVDRYRSDVNAAQGFETRYLSDWIDVDLIARHTEAVGKLVPFPFYLLALIVIARTSLFDNWRITPILLAVYLGGFALACVATYVLWKAAQDAKSIAIERMKIYKLRIAGNEPPRPAAAAQVGMLLDRIENERRGAFRPISEQPLLRAVLYPISTFGGLQIVEYFISVPK